MDDNEQKNALYRKIGPRLMVGRGANPEKVEELLTPKLIEILVAAQSKMAVPREQLLRARGQRQEKIDSGDLPQYETQTSTAASDDKWQVANIPADLQMRRVEITGPVNDAKMVINMLSRNAAGARADTAMLDFEDSMMPRFSNVLAGIANVKAVAENDLKTTQTDSRGVCKKYILGQADNALMMIRVRGLHLVEKNILVDGEAISAGLFDFISCFYHTAKKLLKRGITPTYYIPKCEHFLEARWWNDLFKHVQRACGVEVGTLRATFLIETLPAALQIEEILYEFREHAAGLNVGRWDKIFSDIKVLKNHPNRISSDRKDIGMNSFWMKNYAQRLIKICHKRGAFAIGGMSAFTPGKTKKMRQLQTEKVLADKKNEYALGHDGCWVSHPYFIGAAMEAFPKANQLEKKLESVNLYPDLLMDCGTKRPTLAGMRTNIRVAIAYMEGWRRGIGCVSFDNLMEDLATLEISRAQIFQWLKHQVLLQENIPVTPELVSQIFSEEHENILREIQSNSTWKEKDLHSKKTLIDNLKMAKEQALEIFTRDTLSDFLTLESELELGPECKWKKSTSSVVDVAKHNNRDFEEDRMMSNKTKKRMELWQKDERWSGVKRDYNAEEVTKLQGNYVIEYSIARLGAERLWKLLQEDDYVNALGALTGNQAIQQVKAGLKAIYLSGWQVAADANLGMQMYPDQSLYPANSVPIVVKRINNALLRADQVEFSEGKRLRDWLVPIVADAEAGFGGALNAFELMKGMIEAGAAGVHFEDQLASEKKCGHLGGKVLIPTAQFIKTLTAARLAADVQDVPTLLIARTDADAAQLITSDIDERDRSYLTGERTPEGFFRIRNGIETAILRAKAYAPYADLIWCETSTPDLTAAKKFAESVQKEFPNKMLAYNCSPSFNWKRKLDASTIAKFQKELGAMGYKFQFVTLAGFHALNNSMFELASDYKKRGMSAYSELQEREFANEERGYTATKHQREVGTGYFDQVSTAISGGQSSTLALKDSTEEAQF